MDPEGPFTRLKKTEVSQPTSSTSATPSTSLTTFTKIVSIRKTSTNCCFIIILSLAPVPSSHTWCFSVRRHRTETFGSGPGLLFSLLQRYGKLRSGPISRTVFRNGEASVTEVSFRTCGVLKKSYSNALSRKVFFFKVVLFEASQVFSYQSE